MSRTRSPWFPPAQGLRCLLILLVAGLGGCRCDPREAPPRAEAGLAAAAATPCDTPLRLLSLAELARTCNAIAVGIEPQGPACHYRLQPVPAAAVRIQFAPRDARLYEAEKVRLGRGRAAPALGARALAFLDRARGRSAFLFEVQDALVTVEALRQHCEVGPLARIARLLYERAARSPASR